MTITRLRESGTGPGYEQRNLAGINPSSWAYTDPAAIPPHGWGLGQQRAGVLVTPHTMLTVDVVYMALRVISNNVISMGNLHAYTEKFDANSGHTYKQFMENQPAILTNTFGGGSLGGLAGTMMQCTGMDRTIWSMALFNEAFWYVLERDRLERPATIEVLHPAFMEVKVEDSKVKFIYGSGSNRAELNPWNTIQIPMKSLPAARRALSPTDYAGVAGALAMAAYEFGSSWFSQGAAPSFILSTDQKLGKDEIDRIAQKFLIEHSGLQQAHLPLVLDSGVKADKALNTPDEAQFLETLEYSRQCLGSWFGIPASKMPNALQRQPAAPPHTRQEEQMSFALDTLSGYTVPLEEVHSALVPDEGVKARFEKSLLSEPDSQFLAQEIQALRMTQVATINDGRVRKLGWAPIEGGDDVNAPFASNVAPGQTGQTGGNAAGGQGKQSPSNGTPARSSASDDDAERQAFAYLCRRVADYESAA